MARAEVDRTLGSLGLTERQEETVRAMSRAIVNKLLHGPTARLRAEAGQGPLGDAAAQLFGLHALEDRISPLASAAQQGPAPEPPGPTPAPDPAPGPLEPDPAPTVVPFTRRR